MKARRVYHKGQKSERLTGYGIQHYDNKNVKHLHEYVMAFTYIVPVVDFEMIVSLAYFLC